MSEREAFDHILASLHEAALGDAHWSTASGLIDEALRTHGNSLVFGDGDSAEDIQIYFAGCFFRGQRHRELERWYFESYYALDERPPRIRHAPDSRLFHTTELYTEEEMKTSVAYNEALPRGHVQNSIHVRLDGPRGSRIIWVANDPVDEGGWSSAQFDSIRRLLPHIRQYVRVRQALAGADALGATLTRLLDATGLGIIQLDGRGRIIEANDRAWNSLRTADSLFDEAGFLHARMPEDNAELQRLLGLALPPSGAHGAGGSMMVRRSSPLPPLVLHVNPVSRQETDLRVWPVTAFMLVVDPTSHTHIDPAVAAATLDLTAMESRVAVLLAEGMNVREVAAATGRKESTIRSHVKHMFRQAWPVAQADLVRLVQSLSGTPEYRR